MKPNEALLLLQLLGAPDRLLRHIQLVSEAGEMLLRYTEKKKISLDADWVRSGILLHDAGKIKFPKELYEKGAEHEPAGEKLLLEHKVPAHLARCCVSHAQWAALSCSLEELLVALADTLWKGIRKQELELKVIDELAGRLKKQRWDIFMELDDLFEKIAAGGHERLERS